MLKSMKINSRSAVKISNNLFQTFPSPNRSNSLPEYSLNTYRAPGTSFSVLNYGYQPISFHQYKLPFLRESIGKEGDLLLLEIHHNSKILSRYRGWDAGFRSVSFMKSIFSGEFSNRVHNSDISSVDNLPLLFLSKVRHWILLFFL